MDNFHCYRIDSIAANIDRRRLLEYFIGKEFILAHDFYNQSTSLISKDDFGALNSSGIGFKISETGTAELRGTFECISCGFIQLGRPPENEIYRADDIYKVFAGSRAKVYTAFCSVDTATVISLKNSLEGRISRIETRQSKNTPAKSSTSSTSTDSYYQSYEKEFIIAALENLNSILLSKCSSYKTLFMMEQNEGQEGMINYIKSVLPAFERRTIRARSINELYSNAKSIDSLPLSYANTSHVLAFSPSIKRTTRINSGTYSSNGDIAIGKLIESAVDETEKELRVDSRAMNLGTLISGVPGTGKTKLAQGVIEQAVHNSACIIISPTGEWNGFAVKNRLNVIKFNKSKAKINFFRCESDNVKGFYENLAMLISSAIDCGPYKNSMENCLLAAFRRIYIRTSNPDPQDVFEEIEESIIEQHGRRTGGGVRYTKHGENIKAALEKLRQLIMNPQLAYSEGVGFKPLAEQGAVFDLSEMSNSIKPLLYALILNQAYTICDSFDVFGDNEIRMIICLEEAQMIFGADSESGAVLDLRQRIQDFRKKGVALLLVTHNVIDISPEIRRLCQNKFYFRQSADVSKHAANDLIFNDEPEKVASALKSMGQRQCAINFIRVENGEKIVPNSVFAKTDPYPDLRYDFAYEDAVNVQKTTSISFRCDPDRSCSYEILYLGGRIFSGTFNDGEAMEIGLLENKRYILRVLGEKKRDTKSYQVLGGHQNEVDVLQNQHKNES